VTIRVRAHPLVIGAVVNGDIMEKIIHQIWVGPNAMPQREQDFVRKMQLHHPTFQHMFWYDGNMPELPEQIKPVYDSFANVRSWAMCADILRLYVVYLYGGIYLDVDYDTLQGMESWNLENYSGYIHHGDEGDYPISNGHFGFSRGHPASEYLVSKITMDNTHWYGPHWFGKYVKEYYKLPMNCTVEDLRNALIPDNLKVMSGEEQRKYVLHYSLYSWAPENVPTYSLRSTSHPLNG